jgi:hypothetical protein
MDKKYVLFFDGPLYDLRQMYFLPVATPGNSRTDCCLLDAAYESVNETSKKKTLLSE